MRYRPCPLCGGEVRAAIGPDTSGDNRHYTREVNDQEIPFVRECDGCGYRPLADQRPTLRRSEVRELIENVRMFTPEQIDELIEWRLQRTRRAVWVQPEITGIKIEV
ncbi:hypothetical protein [Micromonospora sp. NPDC005652]|uniref:hypothetical protein n=1 Tax=Micromonospora sp. NPDC005652 TaxID=3157046 RepID=UPI0033EBDBAF